MNYGLDVVNIDIHVVFWNINGRTHLLKTEYISQWIKSKFDLCFLSETHFTKGQLFDLLPYISYHNAYSNIYDKHPRGGISCFVNPNLFQYIVDVNCDTPENIVVTFKGGHKIFGCYIPPVDSMYFSEDNFAALPNHFHPIDSEAIILGGGDLNCRVGDITQNVPFYDCLYRKNPDREVNSHGRTLKRICRSYNCFLLILAVEDGGRKK